MEIGAHGLGTVESSNLNPVGHGSGGNTSHGNHHLAHHLAVQITKLVATTEQSGGGNKLAAIKVVITLSNECFVRTKRELIASVKGK